MSRSGWGAVLGVALLFVLGTTSTTAVATGPAVLLVGPAGTAGAQYQSIQAAVNAASPGDWILVAPGIYHEKGSDGPTDSQVAGVMITKNDIHLRGMNRNQVIVDGTNPAGTQPYTGLASACPSAEAAQDSGPTIGGVQVGRNGVEAYKASGVHIENMTVCNFLSANGSHTGNEVWWNAGDGSGLQQPLAAFGAYLTATSTYYKDGSSPIPQYGIFTSNIAADPARGTSLIDVTYSNNMADSAYYIGACPDCNIVLNRAWAENAALGYSGTNGSGRVTISNGTWHNLHAGIVPNTLNNDDAPPPQDGRCPAGVTAPDPVDGPGLCFVVTGNYVYDNNNPDTPGSGIAGVAPVGTGIELSGTKGDLVKGNLVTGNSSWGIIAHDYPDPETFPSSLPAADDCAGGTGTSGACFFSSGLNRVIGNVLTGNGANANPGNADIANEQAPADLLVGPGTNCFLNNVTGGSGALTEFPPNTVPGFGLQESACNGTDSAFSGIAGAQLVCASGLIPSTTGLPVNCNTVNVVFNYPAHNVSADSCGSVAPGSVPTGDACLITLANTVARASRQPTLDPCVGPPPNAYCGNLVTTQTSSLNTSAGRQLPDARPVLVLWLAGGVLLGIARLRRA